MNIIENKNRLSPIKIVNYKLPTYLIYGVKINLSGNIGRPILIPLYQIKMGIINQLKIESVPINVLLSQKIIMTRAEHLKWCKQRAIEYVDKGNVSEAFASFQSDMTKHPDTNDHMALQMGTMLLLGGNLTSQHQMRKWIDGFN